MCGRRFVFRIIFTRTLIFFPSYCFSDDGTAERNLRMSLTFFSNNFIRFSIGLIIYFISVRSATIAIPDSRLLISLSKPSFSLLTNLSVNPYGFSCQLLSDPSGRVRLLLLRHRVRRRLSGLCQRHRRPQTNPLHRLILHKLHSGGQCAGSTFPLAALVYSGGKLTTQ